MCNPCAEAQVPLLALELLSIRAHIYVDYFGLVTLRGSVAAARRFREASLHEVETFGCA
jgi:hypothetical protein